MDPQCQNCRYVAEFEGALECRRYAPRPVYQLTKRDRDGDRDDPWIAEAVTVWPNVTDDDWCGEFQAK